MKDYFYIPKTADFDDLKIPDHDIIIDIYKKVMEDCLRQLLRQYLGREPEIEDGKLLTIGQFPDDRPMLIAISGHHVGTLKISQDIGKVTALFTPA